MFLIFSIILISVAEVFSKYDLLDQDFYEIDKTSTIFEQYIKKFEKIYSPAEYSYRLGVFKKNLMDLNKWNEVNPGMYGVNEFSDITFEEFSQTYMGFNGNLNTLSGDVFEIADFREAINRNETIPEHLDWRDFGYVTPVKKQFGCGSCYAFSAIGHLEGRYAKKHNTKAVSLSEQQIIDCDTLDYGCYGGLPHYAFMALKRQGGAMLREDYPYEGRLGDCMFDKSKIAVNVTEGAFGFNMNEEELKEYLSVSCPASIAMTFTREMVYIKTGKVFKPSNDECKNARWLNHAVLLVGYGRDNDDDYWIIKNSWGTHWGDRGYMRIVRNQKECNIGAYIAIALID